MNAQEIKSSKNYSMLSTMPKVARNFCCSLGLFISAFLPAEVQDKALLFIWCPISWWTWWPLKGWSWVGLSFNSFDVLECTKKSQECYSSVAWFGLFSEENQGSNPPFSTCCNNWERERERDNVFIKDDL